ncbi:MAG: response regulator [Acidobacteriota bacterium]|jgi:CheY-like chemotaxis protein
MNTVLIVEDDRNLLRLYQAELETEGYRVVTASNGSEAAERVALETPDVIVMDIRMPGRDGLDTMAEILREYGRIPIILNTAYSSYLDDFLTWAAEAYIIKSGDLEPLKNKIREILAAHASPCDPPRNDDGR